jgi:hypothetical protein
MNDLETTYVLVFTLIISMSVVLVLINPFIESPVDAASAENSQSLKNKGIESQDARLRREDYNTSKSLVLDSLEDLELAKKTGMLTEEEYLEQKKLLMSDASLILNK